MLKRAIRTLWYVQDELDLMWIPTIKAWQLNERHYGALQGLNKAETAAKFGDEQVLVWRRSYDTPPPVLTPDDERYPGHDPRYAGLSKAELPLTESLKETVARVIPYSVSYTHLDVYKRQLQHRGARLPDAQPAQVHPSDVEHRDAGRLLAPGRHWPAGRRGLCPVSYTHLDVYKRQS